jgi:hypothetical protein
MCDGGWKRGEKREKVLLVKEKSCECVVKFDKNVALNLCLGGKELRRIGDQFKCVLELTRDGTGKAEWIF